MKRATGFIIYKKLTEGIEYLLLQTSYGIHHWTPPKGHVDPGENDLQTAYRETLEEAGMNEKHLHIHEDMKFELQYLVSDQMKTTVYWLAKLKDIAAPVKLSDEHQDFKWAGVDEACKLVVYDDMQKVLRDSQEYLDMKSVQTTA